MRNMLLAMATAATVVSPGFGNPCRVCFPVKKRVAVKVKREVIVKKEVAAVGVPVFFATYLAQVTPAPAVTYNITTPAPAPAPVQQISTYVAPPVVAVSGYAAGYAAQGYSAQGQYAAGQQQTAAVTTDRLAAALEAINQRLCKLEEAAGLDNGMVAPATAPGLPKFLGVKCAACHNATTAREQGGGFVLFDKGTLAALTDRQRLSMFRHLSNRTMPPPGNKLGVPALTPEEQREGLDWLARLK